MPRIFFGRLFVAGDDGTVYLHVAEHPLDTIKLFAEGPVMLDLYVLV